MPQQQNQTIDDIIKRYQPQQPPKIDTNIDNILAKYQIEEEDKPEEISFFRQILDTIMGGKPAADILRSAASKSIEPLPFLRPFVEEQARKHTPPGMSPELTEDIYGGLVSPLGMIGELAGGAFAGIKALRGLRGAGPAVELVDEIPDAARVIRGLPGDDPDMLRLPALGETSEAIPPFNPATTRFFGGPQGIGDELADYPIHLSELPPNASGTILPREAGEITNLPANVAAERGLGFGQLRDIPDPATMDPTFRAMVPERYLGDYKPNVGVPQLRGPKGPTNQPPAPVLAFDEGGKVVVKPNVAPEGDLFRATTLTGDEARLVRAMSEVGADDVTKLVSKSGNPTAAGAKLVDKVLTPKDRLLAAIGNAKPIRKLQDQIYSVERKRRLAIYMDEYKKAIASGDREAILAAKGKIAGDLPKVNFEGIGSQLSQDDIMSLFREIKDSPNIRGYEFLRTTDALEKILNSGLVPQPSELNLLSRVFGEEVAEGVAKLAQQPSKWKGLRRQIAEELNVPRTIMSSFDMSAPFRQGVGLAHRKEFREAFPLMFRVVGNPVEYKKAMDTIKSNKYYTMGQDSGLFIADILKPTMNEEKFYGAGSLLLRGKYNPAGQGVQASNRAYSIFLNKMRQDTFTNMMDNAVELFKNDKKTIFGNPLIKNNPLDDQVFQKRLAEYINTATGRGRMPLQSMEAVAHDLSSVFFSPRLIASRLQMFNPIYYTKMPPMVRREAIKSLMSVAGMWTTFLGLSSTLPAMGYDVDISNDPTNSDFGKIRIGNTRLDPAAGFQQFIVLASRIAQNQTTSPVSGHSAELGSSPVVPDEMGLIGNFFSNKLNPVASLGWELFKDYRGRKGPGGTEINADEEIMERAFPMFLKDMYDISRENPDLLPVAILPGFFGIGTQTFGGEYNPNSAMKPLKPIGGGL